MRILMFCLMFLNCICGGAQTFSCADYTNAVDEFNKAKSSNIKKFAARLKEQGYYERSTGVRYIFRIEHNNTDSLVLREYTKKWYAGRINKRVEDVTLSFNENNAFIFEEKLNLPEATVLGDNTNAGVSANIGVVVSVKNGFLDIAAICPCYSTTFHNKSLHDLIKDREFEHYTIHVMDVFPFKSQNLDKMYATAYVYSSARCLDIIGDFLNFLKKQ